MSELEPPQQDQPPLAERWRQAWFFLSLLAVLFWGVAGIVGAATASFGLRAAANKLPWTWAIAAGLAIGAATVSATRALLGR